MIPPWPRDIDLAGDLAIVAVDGNGLWVIDIGNPTAPFEIGRARTTGDALAVSVLDHLAFVADDGSGLAVFDVSSCADRLPPPRRAGGRVAP